MAPVPAPDADQLALPPYGVRYPKPGYKANKLPDAFQDIAEDITTVLTEFGIPPVVSTQIVTANSAAARDAHWGAPASAATRRALQDLGALTTRLDLGYTEQYFAGLTDGGANPGGRTVAGWYRVFPGTLDSGWQALALQNAWVAYGGGTAAPRYRLKDGRVQLSGLIKNGTVTAGTTIATLPAGYRPAATDIYAIHNGATARGVQVDTNGNIQCGVGITNGELGLASISFWVD